MPTKYQEPYRICTRCIMDTTDPIIHFDRNGHCNHCEGAINRLKRQVLPPEERKKALERLVQVIKADGQRKQYDCVMGVSGGVDSTMTVYQAKQLGLRPFAVHVDNGWNSDLSVDNVKKALQVLQIELHTIAPDWQEFRDLQLSFFKASVPNIEIPTDHVLAASLWHLAKQQGLRFILTGNNLATEAIEQSYCGHYRGWYPQDLKHLLAIHRRFGTLPLKTMPRISLIDYLRLALVDGIRQVPFLNYFQYDRDQATTVLQRDLGFQDYGRKHFESVFTRWFQGYFLPVKFGYDKRRPHLSSLICSDQITREAALQEMEKPVYEPNLLKEDTAFVMAKLELSQAEFDQYFSAPPRDHTDFPCHYFLLHTLKKPGNVFRRIATRS